MQADQLRPIGVIVAEVAPHRLAHVVAQLVQRVGLGDDRGIDGVGGVAAFVGFYDGEEDFNHRARGVYGKGGVKGPPGGGLARTGAGGGTP